jgi:RNA 2',3'-cyclic 3'-phosphodiesterase
VRLFVAVWPSHETMNTIAALDRPEVPGLRWTTEDQWHVTLRFLGGVDDELVEPLATALPRLPAPEVVLGPATARLGRSILVVPVAGLDDLAAAVLDATSSLVPEDEPRPFQGHLTLARARRGAVPASLVGLPVAGSWRASRVSLVRSETHPAGARYTEVAGVDLEGA